MTRIRIPFVLFAIALAALIPSARAADDWPMLAHDAARSGATATELRPPFARKWYRAFPDEGLMAGVQPVIADDTVYLGTLRGVLHAMDADTGADRWAHAAGAPILHACAVADGKVFFAAGDKLHALDARTGKPIWSQDLGPAAWNAPAVHDGFVYVGGRDGKLYCFAAADGSRRWSAETRGPILASPAIDAANNRVVVASDSMHVHARDRKTGAPLWTSEKLPGVSFRGYHPTIAPDGSVLLVTQPHAGGDAIQQIVLDMAKEVFGDFASWRHNKEENAKLRAQNFKRMEDPQTYTKQLDYLRKRLTAEPALQTFFVLDGQTGRQKFVAPVVYAESMNGTASPAVVTPGGKVLVKYSALLRSRYEHYSPFLNVGTLDTVTGHVTPVMDQSRTYGWYDSLLLVHDEQSQLSAGGRVLFNAHQDNVNALDLETLKGYPNALAHNVHEPPAGAAVGIWAAHLAGKPLPTGWEWFARGTAVYGGGSTIDVPVAIAGDSFYYLPTHELNAGCVLLAYQMKPDGPPAEKAAPPNGKLSPEQWKSVQWSGRWDWDTLASPRLEGTLKSLPEIPQGTRQRPLTDAARATVATITDNELTYQILSRPPLLGSSRKTPESEELDRAVAELISRPWRPLVLPAGKAPAESYRFFTDPTETLYTLALVYPQLRPERQADVQAFVAQLRSGAGPLSGPAGKANYDANAGDVRTLYDPAPDKLLKLASLPSRSDTARLYPLWLWAHVTGDWSRLVTHWPALRTRIRAEPEEKEFDCGNARVAGLIAACRIAKKLSDKDTLENLLPQTRDAIRQRIAYEHAHPRGGLVTATPDRLRSVLGRWHHLTPDVARLIRLYAPDVTQGLMDTQIDHHRPMWWLAWSPETLWANEVPNAFPTHARDIFNARAMILRQPKDALLPQVDLPWCKADEFYIQKLAMALHNVEGEEW